MRSLICTIAIPRKRLQAYSLAKLYQSAASSVAFLLSPQLTIRAWVIIMAVIETLSATAYIIVSKQILREQCGLEDTKEEKTTPSKRKIKPVV
ncbi:hypothetical protein OESDEN_12302 [Oesophagostomum dentatum]|uniref:Uncharacterized protein n=1 Tax=Oesophagostomum dentatum TaxID=61180 RepID=A0A0B1SVI4_OESDE|nr:hypothetical protein OESDEN_12302 [Oesophagostomum dentatum]